MNKKAISLILICSCLLGGFFILLGFYPLKLYYDGYLTILKDSTKELNYVFVPKQMPAVVNITKQVKLEYFVQNY